MIQWMSAIWPLVPLPFLNPAWTSGSSRFTYYWSLAWRILSITLLACEMKCALAAAAAAKSLQSCPTLCDPIDGCPPGSPVPGILQARILEWGAIAFSNAWKWKMKVKSCLTLSDPMDGSPPGSSIHGILQARVLEWAAIAFSNVPLVCPLKPTIFLVHSLSSFPRRYLLLLREYGPPATQPTTHPIRCHKVQLIYLKIFLF